MAVPRTGGMVDPSAQLGTAEQSGTSAEEQETNDQAGTGTEDGAGEEEESASSTDEGSESGDEGADEEVSLLSEEEAAKLDDKGKALLKSLNRAATQKFQELSSTQKKLEPYLGFVEALDRNPKVAITELAKHLGMTVADTTVTAAKETAADITEAVTKTVADALGEEYGDLAQKLAPALKSVIDKVVEQQVQTLREGQEQLVSDSALREANAALEAFGQKHPDWKKHEKRMTEISQKLPPSPDVSEAEYLEMIYTLTTRDGKTGDAIKKTNAKMAESARGSAPGKPVSGKVVSNRPARLPSFAEAAQAAREGRRLE